MMKCGEKLGKLIFLERRLEDTESKVTKFGSSFAKKYEVNEIEISKFHNHEKPKLKLKLTKITIQN